MPAGTIGRIYIPATAAVTWEVYYPQALKASVNGVQDYGAPLQGMMKNIKKIGGDPMSGGTSVSAVSSSGSCGGVGTVAGEGMTKTINWAMMIANNNGYGYDQATRTSGYTNWLANPSCTDQCGSFDCSSFLSAALTVGGYFTNDPNFDTTSEASVLTQAGFTKVATSASTSSGLQAGDILLVQGHTEMYIGNNQLVGAHENENHGITGGKVGDQTGNEISIIPFYNDGWTAVFRASK